MRQDVNDASFEGHYIITPLQSQHLISSPSARYTCLIVALAPTSLGFGFGFWHRHTPLGVFSDVG